MSLAAPSRSSSEQAVEEATAGTREPMAATAPTERCPRSAPSPEQEAGAEVWAGAPRAEAEARARHRWNRPWASRRPIRRPSAGEGLERAAQQGQAREDKPSSEVPEVGGHRSPATQAQPEAAASEAPEEGEAGTCRPCPPRERPEREARTSPSLAEEAAPQAQPIPLAGTDRPPGSPTSARAEEAVARASPESVATEARVGRARAAEAVERAGDRSRPGTAERAEMAEWSW